MIDYDDDGLRMRPYFTDDILSDDELNALLDGAYVPPDCRWVATGEPPAIVVNHEFQAVDALHTVSVETVPCSPPHFRLNQA
jgi:hypothetical protein